MSRVLSYIASNFWAMRQREFDVMTLVAVRNLDALEKRLDEIESAPNPETMTAKRGERLMNTRYVEIREGSVAVIDVNGRLAKRMGFFAEVCEGGTSTETLLRDFQTALDNPNVSAIVLNIDSPGGEAFGINELAGHIHQAHGKKPIKAYISGLGCSGAYWIASACDEIICDKSAFLGSIGVVSVWIDDTEAYKLLGFDKKVVTSSNAPKKRLDLNTDEGMKEFQAELDAIEKVFIGAVARNRKKKREEVIKDFNQGGVLLGDEAVKAGMADRTGNLEQVIKELARNTKKRSLSTEQEGEFDMSFKDKFKEFGAALGFNVTEKPVLETEVIEAENAPNVETEPKTDAADKTPAVESVEAEKAKLAEERAKLFAEKAKTFAERELTASRLLPAERAAFEATYLQALKDDAENPLAEGSRAEKLETMQKTRQPHRFTSEQIAPDATAQVLVGEPAEGVSPERKKALMSKTPLGRSALKLVKE